MGSSGRVTESPVWRGVIGVATRDNFFDKNGNDNGSKLVQMSASLALSHQGRGRTKTPSECNFCCNHDHCQGALTSGCSLFFLFPFSGAAAYSTCWSRSLPNHKEQFIYFVRIVICYFDSLTGFAFNLYTIPFFMFGASCRDFMSTNDYREFVGT